jgi:hypothetical protein
MTESSEKLPLGLTPKGYRIAVGIFNLLLCPILLWSFYMTSIFVTFECYSEGVRCTQATMHVSLHLTYVSIVGLTGLFLLLNIRLGWYLLLANLSLLVIGLAYYAIQMFGIFGYWEAKGSNLQEKDPTLYWGAAAVASLLAASSVFFFFRLRAVYRKWNTYFRNLPRDSEIAQNWPPTN